MKRPPLQVHVSRRIIPTEEEMRERKMAKDLQRKGEALARLFHAFPDVCFVSGRTAQTPRVRPGGLEEIVARAEKAPLGVGEETVVNRKLRRVLQTEDVEVEWGDLGEVLEEVERRLVPNFKLRAQFYKLLIYSKGDFFLKHRDTKRGEGHILTLAVDCGYSDDTLKGGELIFYNQRDKPISWSSKGEWGCWFTQIFHSVQPLETGTRVVATYNIYVDKEENTKKQQMILEEKNTSLFTENIWNIIVSYCKNPLVLSQVSKFFRMQYTPPRIFSFMLQQLYPEIRSKMEYQGKNKYFGFLLKHTYSFETNAFLAELNPSQLIGADKILADTIQSLNLNYKVVRAQLVVEKVDDCPKNERYPSFRIASHVDDEIGRTFEKFRKSIQKQEEGIQIPDKYQRYLNDKKQEDGVHLDPLLRPDINVESDLEHVAFPFYGVVWCDYETSLVNRKHCDFEGSESRLWGNGGTFSLNWYQIAVLLVEMSGVPKQNWAMSSDFVW